MMADNNIDAIKFRVILAYHLLVDECARKCWLCAVIICPHHNPNHYKDKCPSCNPELQDL